MKEYHVTLNEYQRDNLLQLLNLVTEREPFTVMNSGDWVMEVWNKLEGHAGSTGANLTTAELDERIEAWQRRVKGETR